MTDLKTFARAVGLGLCVAAFTGSALADPGNGNGGPAATPPGQEQKAETPAATAPAPAPQAAAPGQEQKAEQQEAKAAKKAAPKPAAKSPAAKSTAAKAAAPGQAKKAEKAESKPAHAAKPAKPAKSSGSYKNTSSGTDLKKGMLHKHTICHATGSESNPYVRITPSVSGVFHGHMDHQGDEDIVPPFVYKGVTYSQNWDARGQAIFNAGCALPAGSTPSTQVTQAQQTQTSGCPAATTTTERVLVGIKHYTGAVKNGQRQYVVISPSEKSAHMNGKHGDDEAMYETRTVTRTASGEVCSSTSNTTSSNTTSSNTTSSNTTSSNVNSTQSSTAATTQQSTAVGGVAGAQSQSPAGGVAGVQSQAPAAVGVEKQAAKKAEKKPVGGVLGAVASAPKAVAKTATSGTLPFTGIPLWIAALIGGGLLAAGLVLRRTATS